jgi:hypothetical protein
MTGGAPVTLSRTAAPAPLTASAVFVPQLDIVLQPASAPRPSEQAAVNSKRSGIGDLR